MGIHKIVNNLESQLACFQHDATYGGFIDLPKPTASDKMLRDKAFSSTKYPKYDTYQHGLASVVYQVIDKNSRDVATSVTHKRTRINSENQQLAE